jgi:hypothetical protein
MMLFEPRRVICNARLGAVLFGLALLDRRPEERRRHERSGFEFPVLIF